MAIDPNDESMDGYLDADPNAARDVNRQTLISIIAGCMAGICDRPDEEKQAWEKEADVLIVQEIENRRGGFTIKMPDDMVELLDYWQTERVVKGNDFPLTQAAAT
jgi:hypothetical protein